MNAEVVATAATGLMVLAAWGCAAGSPAKSDGGRDGAADRETGVAPCVVGGTMAGTPIVVGCGQQSPARIIVSGDSIFWTNEIPGVTVSRAARAGGGPSPVAFGNAPAFGIAVTETAVYWTEPTAGRVMKISRGGGPASAVATGLKTPLHLACDGTNLYWTSDHRRDEERDGGTPNDAGSGGGTITRLALLAGSKPVTMVSGLSRPYAIAVDDRAVYWTDLADGTVMKLALGGGGGAGRGDGGQDESAAPVTMANGSRQPSDLALANGHVYWADQAGSVWRVPRDDGPPQLLVSGQATPFAVAADQQYVYWTAVGDGTVMRAPAGGGAAAPVAVNQDEPHFIALDDTTVYWTLRGSGGRVVKAAK